MKIESPCKLTRSQDIKPGEFYGFWPDNELCFGIAITDDAGSQLGFEFVKYSAQQSIPIAIERQENQYLVTFPDAIVRVDHQSITDDIKPGAIIEVGGIMLMAAYRHFDRFVARLDTGILCSVPDGPRLVYNRWSLGVMRDARFEPLFQFDATEANKRG
jgi:hypothetical protein